MYGAILASTLISLGASGAMRNARSFHLVMADTRGLNLSFVHNLRQMAGVQVHLVDEEQARRYSTKATYSLALDAPDKAGPPSDLPSIILEDDVRLVDAFPSCLEEFYRSAQRHARWLRRLRLRRQPDESFFGTLYTPDGANMAQPDVVRAQHANLSADEPPGRYRAWRYGFGCCTQGVFFSDGALRRRVAGTLKQRLEMPALSDLLLKAVLEADEVLQFVPSATLLQHMGTSSALFSQDGKATNPRFHRALSFPFMERYVTDDDKALWVG
jgi:hypothetical protein